MQITKRPNAFIHPNIPKTIDAIQLFFLLEARHPEDRPDSPADMNLTESLADRLFGRFICT